MLKVLGKTFLRVLKKILQYKYSLFILMLVVVFISIWRINLKVESKYSGIENEFKLVVLEKKKKNNQCTIVFREKEKIITIIDNFPYDVGDIVIVKGKLEKINNNTIFNLFNYREYLQSRGIHWKLKISEVSLFKKNSNILIEIKKKIVSKIEKYQYKEYLYAFILGDTSYFNSDIRYKYQLIGLSYILSIGSFQIMFIIKILEKIERKLRVKKSRKIIINILVIGLYILFESKIIGVLRSGLCYILKSILDYKKIKIKYYKIILIIGIILLIINPNYLNNIGFLYSFGISLAISLLRKRIKGNYFKRFIKISIIAFIIGLPITIYNNYEINFLSVIFTFLLIPIYHFIVFPLSIIIFFFPFLCPFFNLIIFILEKIISEFFKIDFLTFVFGKPSMFLVLLYYAIISLSFYKKKFFLLFTIVLIIHHNINLIIKENLVTFLDVGEGDAIIVKSNNNVSLIDTGGSLYYNYSINIIKYLKSLGIFKVNNLILTHGDFDHMGWSFDLVNNIKIEKVIFNCGSYNELEKELIKVLDKSTIPYYSCIKELKVNSNKFLFLQTKEYNNENDNSNVIYTEINGYKFMFMGDAGVAKEKDILEKYNISNIDILKVGHHGSKTSSSRKFINGISPKYAVISVGKNNIYHHPNKDVLKTLEISKIYRTDVNGSIMFKIKNSRLQIEPCPP